MRKSCTLQQNNFNLDMHRFISAQERGCGSYEKALEEIKRGRKESHWIWYIFPQLAGLGMSEMSEYYGIKGFHEAQTYRNHPVLGARLEEISRALLLHKEKSACLILGKVDAMKVCSCMTLFDAVSPCDVFAEVLDCFYAGQRCEWTLRALAQER